MRDSIAELQLYIDLGTFTLSEEALDTLKTLMTALDKAASVGLDVGYDEYLERRLVALTTCIDMFRTIARKDLDK